MKKTLFSLMVLGMFNILSASFVNGLTSGQGKNVFSYFMDNNTIVYVYNVDNGNKVTPEMVSYSTRLYLCKGNQLVQKLKRTGIKRIITIFPNFKSKKPIYVKTDISECK